MRTGASIEAPVPFCDLAGCAQSAPTKSLERSLAAFIFAERRPQGEDRAHVPAWHYSARNAVFGSTRAARAAGMTLAVTATNNMINPITE
jgi:hypothetical protein